MASTPDTVPGARGAGELPADGIAEFKWSIDNFASLEQTRYDSPLFGAPAHDKTKFFLAIHPKGSQSFWNTTHTLLYLYLKSCERDVLEVRYELSLIDSKGDKCNTQDGKARFRRLTKWSMELNWQYNVLRDYLLDPNSGLLADGKLRVHCRVHITEPGCAYRDAESATVAKVSHDLLTLLTEDKLCDVSLVIGERELHAHQAILAARSPVFGAMFGHETKEKLEARVHIPDMALEVAQQLLRFIYTGLMPPLEAYAEELLAAADKYQLDDLKASCEQYLCQRLDTETVTRYLLQADMHAADRLKAKCIEHITSYPKQVMATEGWKALAATRPELGIQLFQHLAHKTVGAQ